MTKKEEAQQKRQAKLEAEKARIESMKSFERSIQKEHGAVLICGIDEAGRGPFAGPVVAGAVILDLDDPEKEILYLNDSKKLTEKRRETLYREILEKAVAVGVGYSGARIIDQINILQATYRAMRMAVANLTNVSNLVSPEDSVHELVKKLTKYELSGRGNANETPGKASMETPQETSHTAASEVSRDIFREVIHERIVPDYILADAVHIPLLSIPQQGIIKGDAKSISIAAGSIIAKVTRDHIMYEYDKQHPEYGFASHKGYGTAAHIAAIREHGMLDIHRRSFIHFMGDQPTHSETDQD